MVLPLLPRTGRARARLAALAALFVAATLQLVLCDLFVALQPGPVRDLRAHVEVSGGRPSRGGALSMATYVARPASILTLALSLVDSTIEIVRSDESPGSPVVGAIEARSAEAAGAANALRQAGMHA